MEIPSSQPADYEWLKETQRIEAWLKELQLASTVDAQEKEKDKPDPTTPHRRIASKTEIEGVSPTDTSFSGPSIFDRTSRSPCPQRRFPDDASDATSIDSSSDSNCKETPGSPPLYHQAVVVDPQNLPESDYHDPTVPRLTSILSCIQCTSVSLPCSRTLPACTRCLRSSNASTCLLLRGRFPNEMSADFETCTSPVLLKVEDEDERVWKAKMELRKKMKEVWEGKRDRENWVYPRVDTEVRGKWKREGRREQGIEGGMGEGVGQIRFVELRVIGAEEIE